MWAPDRFAIVCVTQYLVPTFHLVQCRPNADYSLVFPCTLLLSVFFLLCILLQVGSSSLVEVKDSSTFDSCCMCAIFVSFLSLSIIT